MTAPTSVPEDLRQYLQQGRDAVIASLEGLSEYDVRRPLTPSGSNLLGLVKHLVGLEVAYLGECVGRPAPMRLPWYDDGSVWDGADMWARPEESREYLLELYRTSWTHADAAIAEVPLDFVATVPWWPEERRTTTFGHLVVRMVAETAQHAGHCDILRESLVPSSGRDPSYGDDAYWDRYVAGIEDAATAGSAGTSRSAAP